jgi:hypothetical protein
MRVFQGRSLWRPRTALSCSSYRWWNYTRIHWLKWKCLRQWQIWSQWSTRSRLAECRRSYSYVSTEWVLASFDISAAYLRIIKLMRLIFPRLRGGASFCSFPRYVAFRSFHAMQTEALLSSVFSIATLKSYSYEMVD